MSLWDVRGHELAPLILDLAGNPLSRLHASLADWDYPLSREALVAMDMYDLRHQIAAGKKTPTPYPRPWKTKAAGQRVRGKSKPAADVMSALRPGGTTDG